MNPENKIRNAFGDLSTRVARDVRPAADPSRPAQRPRPIMLRRPALAIAGLVVVAGAGAATIGLAGGGDDQQISTDSATTSDSAETTLPTEGTADTAVPTDQRTDGSTDQGSTDDQTDGTNDGDQTSSTGDRFRVAAELVAADTVDPFLNVRSEPDADSGLLAKLPASYTGLRATGQTEAAADGGAWLQVELLHPITVADASLGDDRRPRGWVNQAFVEPLADGLPISTDELPPCSADAEDFGTSGTLTDGHVAAMESSIVRGSCLRVVLTFGSGQAPVDWIDTPDGTGPGIETPKTTTLSSGGWASTIDLGPIGSTWPEATDTADDLYLVRGDDGWLDLVHVGRADVIGVTARPDIGALVVDLSVEGPAAIPPAAAGVVLTAPPRADGGTIGLVGMARPFEAVLDVQVLDAAGQPVEATFSGNAQLGTRRGTQYGAATNDWVGTWGRFAVRIEGLAAGDYTVVLNANGAADDPELFQIDLTVDQFAEPPTLATEPDARAAAALIGFANGAPISEVPLADEVTLLLGPTVRATVPAERLADPDAWTIEEPEGFAEFTGPFNPLPGLRHDRLRMTAGPINHCAGPPRDWPAELDGLRQVNIEQIGIDSCIPWFGVHLFFDADDRIAAVAYDLFGP